MPPEDSLYPNLVYDWLTASTFVIVMSAIYKWGQHGEEKNILIDTDICVKMFP